MGIIDKLPFFKKDKPEMDTPPDFSQPMGQDPLAGGDAFGQGRDPLGGQQDPFGQSPTPRDPTSQDLYGSDPLHDKGADPFSTPDNRGGPSAPSNFDNNLFGSEQAPGDTARDYAQQLGQPAQSGAQSSQDSSYAGAITGHEAHLILERLDTIKAELDAIKQRIMRVERYIDEEERKATRKRYF